MPAKLRATPRSMKRAATHARAWTIAQQLRARRGWQLESASAQRVWAVRFGAATFELSAYVSLFFWPSPACMVVALAPKFAAAVTAAIAEEAACALAASLGYRRDRHAGSLVRMLRTDDPKQLVAEIAHVERRLGTRAAKLLGPKARSQDARRWQVVEALWASSWQLGSVRLSRKLGDLRHQVHASVGVLVDSASGRPGIDAQFGAWVPRTSKRWTRFRDHTAAALTAGGFSDVDGAPKSFHFMHWVERLSGTLAVNQATAFDPLLDAGASALGL